MERNVVWFKKKQKNKRQRLQSSTLDVSIAGLIMTVITAVELFFPSILPSLMIFRKLHRFFSLVVCGNGFVLAECLESLTDYLLILYVLLRFHASVVRNIQTLLF